MQEEVDYVQVEVDGGQYVLLGRQLAHQNVCVVDDKAAEEQSTGAGAHQLHRVVVEENLAWGKENADTHNVSRMDYSQENVCRYSVHFDGFREENSHSPS